jgi:Asp-tRNA(Asn)/Glu-tRNA(Gln) amidotransferase A subunit family amidase
MVTQINMLKTLPPKEFERMLKKRYEYVYQMSEKWQKLGLTALVTPFWQHCAPKAKDVYEQGLMGEYSFIWNTTGFPAGVMPITAVEVNE